MKKQKDVGLRQKHHYYFKNGTMDFAVGWLLGYSQIIGLSPGEIYDCLNKVQDNNPDSWVEAFAYGMNYQEKEAEKCEEAGDLYGAGMKYLACVHAARAVLHMCDPASEHAMTTTQTMTKALRKAMECWDTGLHEYNFDFHGKKLPGYFTSNFNNEKPLYIVIGGGDTYREDLYYFGGAEALKRGYNVLLIDLPGQGSTPYDHMHFGKDTVTALESVLDHIDQLGFTGKKVLTAYSGGGYFTMLLMAKKPRIDAWVASTPLFDFKTVIEVAIPSLLAKNPSGWLAGTLTRVAGRLNKTLEAALKKYEWQFGAGGFPNLLQTFADIGVADYTKIDAPSLFLVGLSEAVETKRQTRLIYDSLKTRQPNSKVIEYAAESGADAHCQVNNLVWAQHHIFHWLKEIGLAP
ncbi:alpha/beta hydrolase family protein [Paenibacillus sonchi]|uniref:alpha/beta hydrolase family protein n=1 Tax=Paenibacillus sonchi TaxID=373687 RepID=UPI001E430594|nr:alpha/beta fold hydrolase [Paenibacillus sonchi]MCE3201255.1 alpha/beta fold hydrolase [Paenibacillus sonchi]